jgi:hypothetical protein
MAFPLFSRARAFQEKAGLAFLTMPSLQSEPRLAWALRERISGQLYLDRSL